MNFLHTIESYIIANQLPKPGEKLIVGVSGGADSVALLHVLQQLHYQCVVAHCNFHLRGKESDEDAQFVRQLATTYNVPFESIHFDTKNTAKQRGISIEMAARDLRYDWFKTLRQQHNACAIAIAHHLDDSIETFFINLARGTGLRGLVGIQPRQANVVRPFLNVTRFEIEKYLTDNHLLFRTDSSNFDEAILRNKIRHTIVPAFKSINPSFDATMKENFERLSETMEVANSLVNSVQEQAVKDFGSHIAIEIEPLKASGNIHFYLFELLRPFHFTATTIHDIVNQLEGESGKQFFSATHRLIKDRTQLLVHALAQPEPETYLIDENTHHIDKPLQLIVSEPQAIECVTIDRDKEVACLDADKLRFPLILRRPKAGDYFYPFGKSGKKKLSDFFIDNKWSLLQKEQCWLLISDNQIVWVVGTRIDNRFCIDKNTKKVTKIRFF